MIPPWEPSDEVVDALITMEYGDRWLREDSSAMIKSARTQKRRALVAVLGPRIDALRKAGGAMSSRLEAIDDPTPLSDEDIGKVIRAWSAACVGCTPATQ